MKIEQHEDAFEKALKEADEKFERMVKHLTKGTIYEGYHEHRSKMFERVRPFHSLAFFENDTHYKWDAYHITSAEWKTLKTYINLLEWYDLNTFGLGHTLYDAYEANKEELRIGRIARGDWTIDVTNNKVFAQEKYSCNVTKHLYFIEDRNCYGVISLVDR